jgi:hypothetical protein
MGSDCSSVGWFEKQAELCKQSIEDRPQWMKDVMGGKVHLSNRHYQMGKSIIQDHELCKAIRSAETGQKIGIFSFDKLITLTVEVKQLKEKD